MRDECAVPSRTAIQWRLLCASGLSVLILAAAGCKSPKVIRTYEYLINYDRMTRDYDPLASLVYMPTKGILGEYDALVIDEFSVGEQWVRDPERARAYGTQLRTLLANSLTSRCAFPEVLLSDEPGLLPRDGARALRMSGKITVFSMGSGWRRYFSYWYVFLQGGATDFQIEARLCDMSTGAMVMEFGDRRRHLGNTPWGPYIKTFNSDFVMKCTIKLTAYSLAEFLRDARREPENQAPDAAAAALPASSMYAME